MPSTSRPAASNSCRRSSPEDAAAAPGDIATLVPSPGPQHALPDDAPAARSPLSPPAAPATTRHAPPLQPQHQHQADGRPDQQQQDLGRQLQLAALLLERSRFRDALATLQPLLAKHPGDAAALCLQGRCLAAIGNRPQALAAFAAVLSECPGCLPALLGCAAVYKESGLLPEALAALEAAHELLLQPAEQQPGQQQVAEQRPAPPAAEGDQGQRHEGKELSQQGAQQAQQGERRQQPSDAPDCRDSISRPVPGAGSFSARLPAVPAGAAAVTAAATAAAAAAASSLPGNAVAAAAGTAGGSEAGMDRLAADVPAGAQPVDTAQLSPETEAAAAAAAVAAAGRAATGAVAGSPTAADAGPAAGPVSLRPAGGLAGQQQQLQQAGASASASVSVSVSASVVHRVLPCGRAEVEQALAVVLTDFGTQQKLAGQPGWRQYYERAVRACAAYAPAHYNLGVAAGEDGAAEEAISHYSTAVSLSPGYAEAWCNMGVLLKQQGNLVQAIAAYERALAAAPNLSVVQLNLAAALTEQGTRLKSAGQPAQGVAAYERALSLQPRHAEALYNLGVACAEQGQVDRALFMYQTALEVQPSCAEAHNNLGVLYREQGNMERAVQCYQAALNVRPNFPQGLNNLAVVYTQQGRAQDALQLLHAAVMAAPAYAEAHNNLGVLQRDVGAVPDALASYQRCLQLDPTNRHGGQNLLLGLNYVHPGESRLVCGAHEQWGLGFQALHPPLPPLTPSAVDRTPSRPLIVGYLSPDFFTHSVSYFAEAPLAHHDGRRVKHVAYSCVPKADSKTERLRSEVLAAGGLWRDVGRLPETELAALIRSDRVDVLVELTGHTAGNRLGAVAMRPAPVQATWIGYPNSTGLPAVRYRLTDATCDPLDTTQTFTEELVRLPGCFLCYTPAADAPPVAPLPAAAAGFVTFGSFNALAKQTPEVLQVWAQVLLAVPNSRLVLKNKPFACEVVRNQFWRVFEAAGVERCRVDLLPLAAANRDHLAQYGLMDVSLDPWPYAGTTTTTESLYMGVPCLTLAGSCHAHNVGLSLLTAVGLHHDWVAHSVDEYVSKAAALTQDLPRLAALRAGLRQRMLQSPLCDAPTFVRQLEDVYHQLWQRWLDEQQD
ncbi:hypothetical protein D9Q98_004262 [Chlorella vulgaris]|uniref:protein O-GlcNAc transferase n=1 Tax=Chlorella vulgaris TaxID=3077 RepID=A0A9D4TRN5_CHLVU|nr:hypothetical protein D9Q98_004262 [Chlorella vulgaris]